LCRKGIRASLSGIELDDARARRSSQACALLLVLLRRWRGNGSRVGRTIVAPLANDPRPVNLAFVSCQSVNEGKLNGYPPA
jgi:hypothetical protein